MSDEIGLVLRKVSGALERHDKQLQRLKLLQKYIPRIVKRLPNEYWSDLDGDTNGHVVGHLAPAPDRIKLYRSWPTQPKRDRILRKVQLGRGRTGKLEVKDPGLFVDSTGRFYAYYYAREVLKYWNGRERHEVHVMEIREVEPSAEDLHLFEGSLEPFLDVLVRSGSEKGSENALFRQLTSGVIVRKLKGIFASQPIDKLEKFLSLSVKFAAFSGFIIITWHMLNLHYFPSVSGVGLAQIYLVVVGVVLYCVFVAVVVILTPFMFSRMLYSADIAGARPHLHLAVTVCQAMLFAVCCVVGTVPLTSWIQVSVACCALLVMCAAVAWTWFIGDHQLRSWGYRTFYLCAWTVFGLFAILTLSPAIFAEQRYWRPKIVAVLVLWVALLGIINWSQEVFIRESKNFAKELAILGILLVCMVEICLINPVGVSFRALGLGYLKNQRIYVDDSGRDVIYQKTHVTPLKAQTPGRWYLDHVEILSRIGDPVMIAVPGTYEDAQHRKVNAKAVPLPLRDLLWYDDTPPKLKTGQLPPG